MRRRRRIVLVHEDDDHDLQNLAVALHALDVDTIDVNLGDRVAVDVLWRLGEQPSLQVGAITLDQVLMDSADLVFFKLWRMDEAPVRRVDGLSSFDANQFATREWSALIRSTVHALLDQATSTTVGAFGDAAWHDLKLLALHRAKQFGLSVPETVVGTRMSTFSSGRVVAKAINANPRIGDGSFFPTTELEVRDLDNNLEKRTADVPALIQSRIAASFETRLILLRDRVIAIDVCSDDDAVDIRLSGTARVRDVRPANPFEERVADFGRRCLGLSYCCFDILSDTCDRRWLVDVTPRGSWSWLDGEDLRVSTCVAQELVAIIDSV